MKSVLTYYCHNNCDWRRVMNYIFIALFVMSLIALICTIKDRRHLEEEREQLEKIIEEGNNLYEKVVKENESLRFVKHDYKKQQQISNIVKHTQQHFEHTGHKIIDIILDTKKQEARAKNISFDFDVCKLSGWNITDGETISLFTNLIDNAIEATNKSIAERYITLTINQMDDSIIINLQNSKIDTERPLATDMTTTKMDMENHGYGIKIIREIVHNNNGEIMMSDDINKFTVEIKL